jgi:NAD(P)-dependent dehydrogenase (short-subunit alcohol dehydrogenase family)
MTARSSEGPGHAIVTGGAGGIGAALARLLHRRGHEVLVVDTHASALASTALELGCQTAVIDVASADAMESLAARSVAPAVLCLNAGIVSRAPGAVWETPADDWDRVLAVNLGGVVNGLRAFVPRMLAAGRPAHVVVTGSLAGLATWPGGGSYAVSKHAVAALVEQTALSLAGTPIGVTMLCPDLVRTGISEIGADPDEVAERALAAVDAGRFAVVPPRWHRAVVQRAEALVAGAQPSVPEPGS